MLKLSLVITWSIQFYIFLVQWEQWVHWIQKSSESTWRIGTQFLQYSALQKTQIQKRRRRHTVLSLRPRITNPLKCNTSNKSNWYNACIIGGAPTGISKNKFLWWKNREYYFVEYILRYNNIFQNGMNLPKKIKIIWHRKCWTCHCTNGKKNE